eukprot:m.105933 g.105933  ORF g.105933 m.105933 type:complete len:74 (+) comp27690_c1_seq2:3431-3652(+)
MYTQMHPPPKFVSNGKLGNFTSLFLLYPDKCNLQTTIHNLTLEPQLLCFPHINISPTADSQSIQHNSTTQKAR